MIANKTFNNAIDTLKQLGVEHEQIATTTTGDIWKIDLAKNTLFPLFHINPVNVETGQSTLTYNFQLFVMDAVTEKENWTEANIQSANYLSNEQEVMSSCLQICTDIIGMMRHSKWQGAGELDIDAPVYFTEGEYTLEPFQERFDNLLTGFVFSIGIVVQNDFQTCTIPVADNPIGK
jgi:putative methionine-R-sulfoxide reductase with GAF domain